MITEKGRLLLSKYMLGINPTFATYVAIGCGADAYPISRDESEANYLRKNLVFETARSNIISRGIVNDNGIDKLVFKAELPSENRYGITEIALFSENRNVRAGQFDSKQISQFNGPAESWYRINGSAVVGAIDICSSLIDINNGSISAVSGITAPSASKVAYVQTNNSLWTAYSERKIRKERPRFGNGCIMMRGDYANLTYNGGWNQTTQYGIETSSIGLNMSKNSPGDEIRLAFTIANTALSGAALLPSGVKINIWFEFFNNFVNSTKSFAKYKTSINGNTVTNTTDYTASPVITDSTRYIVHSFKKSDFIVDSNFNWGAINGIRIFASVQNASNQVEDDYWIIFDGIRLENVSTESPTYGMVAYTQVFIEDELELIKSENTTNFIEFRMIVK